MEWIPQSVYSLCHNCCPVFPVKDIWEVGRPTEAESCAINRFLLASPGMAFQKRLFFPLLINPHMLRRETEECGGWRADRAQAGGVVGKEGKEGRDPPPPLSACINKTSLNCLIILCKLRDQGTYWKPPSKHCAECVSVIKPSFLSPHVLIPNLIYSDV